MAKRRVSPERAWFVQEDTSLLEFTTSSANNTSTILIPGADITDEEGILPDERSEWYCERLILWVRPRVNSRVDPQGRPSRFFQMSLVVGDLADQVSWADDNAVAPGAASQFFAGAAFWQNHQRILQQEVLVAYDESFQVPITAAGLVGVSDGSTAFNRTAPLAPFDGPAFTRLDLDTTFSLNATSDLVMHFNVPSPAFDPEWASGDSLRIHTACKALFRKRRA